MYGLQIWHKKFGRGIIVGLNQRDLLIQFDSGTEIQFPQSEWCYSIFLEEAHYKTFPLEKIDVLYDKYRGKVRELNPEVVLLGENYSPAILENMFFTGQHEILQDRMEHSVLIIMCKNEHVKRASSNMKFYRIYGLDSESRKIVSIVSENGARYGLFGVSENDAETEKTIQLLKLGTIIQGIFSICMPDHCDNALNTLRSVSGLSIRDNLNSKQTREIVTAPSVIMDFRTVIGFASDWKSAICHFVVRFSGSEIKKYRDKYQLKILNYYADIQDQSLNITEERKFFAGLALIRISMDEGRRPIITVQKLLNQLKTEEEYQNYQKKREERTKRLFQNVDEMMNDIAEKFEESAEENFHPTVEEPYFAFNESIWDYLDDDDLPF